MECRFWDTGILRVVFITYGYKHVLQFRQNSRPVIGQSGWNRLPCLQNGPGIQCQALITFSVSLWSKDVTSQLMATPICGICSIGTEHTALTYNILASIYLQYSNILKLIYISMGLTNMMIFKLGWRFTFLNRASYTQPHCWYNGNVWL